jgi:hypothetical protein
VILVVGHEKLNVEMQRTYGNRMTVVKIPKSGGVCCSLSLRFLALHLIDMSVAGRRARRSISTTHSCPATTYVLLWPGDRASKGPIGLSNRRCGFRRTPRAQQLRRPIQRALLPTHRRKYDLSCFLLPPPLSRTRVNLPMFFFLCLARVDGTIVRAPDRRDAYRE